MSSCCTCSILNPRPPAHGFLFSLKSHCRAVAEVRAGVRDLCESAAWRKGSSQFHADQADPRPALGEAEMVRSEFSGSSPSTNAVNSTWAFVKSSALAIGSSRSRISPSKRVAAHSPSNWASSVLNSTFLSSVSSASPLLSAASVLPTVGFGVRNTSAADFFRRGLKWI
jgi:hypothetical protein